ncbi:hypothetical protein SAMN05216386_0112 [Nitrosospira briensis]|uniref:Uncharacterized protein n=1 Tax=Nitrosospira briensis TaxID=35799 RepID=A0A1I4XG23_9PROT|nr:hypothetical protein [Nitrosospira briensis]SFN24844.1 hypothetical protein SAMN05216386_0112 [Nitrosospira briensis]
MDIPKRPEPEIEIVIRRLFSDKASESDFFPAEILILPPGERSISDEASVTVSRYRIGNLELLSAPKKAGRPRSDRRHAAIFAEFMYLRHLGDTKLAARNKLLEKYGYADERGVRRITNAPEWDESCWACCIGANTHKRPIVTLFDRREPGYLRGFEDSLLAANGMGWTWTERWKQARWGNIQLKPTDPVPPDLFTHNRYILETFPQHK